MELSEDSKEYPRRGEEPSKVEPGDLLEEGWFFGNLLDRKTRIMSRCFSDPTPSSKVNQEMLVGRSHEDTYSTINKSSFLDDDRFRGRGRGGEVLTTTPQPLPPPRPSLMRTPSMPSPNRNKSSRNQIQSLNNSAGNNFLQRTPSLPAMDMDMNNIEDEESDYSMGKLIRQASLGQSRTLPPRQLTTKKLIPSSIPKQINPRKNPEQEGSMQRRRQQILKQAKTKTRFSNVEIEQGNDFKGSDMVSPTKETKTLPKLQEEKIKEEDEEKNYNEIIKVIRKPYVPEGRRLARTTSASPVLNNIGSQKTADDMKAQIKFWARSVASNMV